ncbi:MAG TPA: right-handed parallel beta-helix repeat-containing protein, partial [Pseudonocardia sp.]|nr:right-handed parallel beta-helix repeat-containing protein [Pseudonocardia sp.]
GGVGHRLTDLLAGVAILASLGVALLVLLPPVSPEAPQPSVSVEEAAAAGAPRGPEPGPPVDPRPAALVQSEDQRIFALVGHIRPDRAPYSVPGAGTTPSTLVLPARAAPYDLAALLSAGAVAKQPDNALLLRQNVLVVPGAQLHLSAPGGVFRMLSGPGGFTSLVAFKGALTVDGGEGAPLTVTSWDPAKNAPDTDESDGRAYLRAVGARMDLRQVRATSLGFWSGRTGGVAWTGTTTDPATGSATAVNFVGNHYGLYTSRSTGLLVNGAQVQGSVLDGIAVGRAAEGTQLWRVSTAQNAGNGISVAKGAHDVSVREVSATGNARNGIYLDGTPAAAGPSADGATTVPASGFVVDGSTVRGNAEHGILVNWADNASLTNNTVAANSDGVVVRGATQGTVLRENRISSPGGFAVAIRDGAEDAVVDRNVLTDALTAVQVQNAVARVTGNEIEQMSLHAVSVIGAGSGSGVADNQLAGRGPSAVDLNRLAFGGVVSVSGNDQSAWVVDRNNAQYLAGFVRGHPLILLWLLILVVPLAARVYLKHRQTRPPVGRHPYPPERRNPMTPVRRLTPSPRVAADQVTTSAGQLTTSAEPPTGPVPSQRPPTGPVPSQRPPSGEGGTRVTVVSPR